MDTANVKMIRGVIEGGTGAVSNSDRQQIEATKLQTAVDKADQQSKTANDGNQAAKDSVKKTLDQLNEINRATNCLTSC
jgi:chromosome segregation ATPase